MPLLGEIDQYTDFQAINRHNAIGSWSLKMPAGVSQSSLIAPGRGVVVFREDEQNFPVFSGPIRQIDRSWSKDDAGAGSITVTGVCDNSILRERLVRTNPNLDWPYEGTTGFSSAGDTPKAAWIPSVWDPYPTHRAPKNSGEFIYALMVANFTARIFDGDWDLSRACLPLDLELVPNNVLRALPDDDLWKGYPLSLEADLVPNLFSLAEVAGLDISIRWQTRSKSIPEDVFKKLFLNITPIADKSATVVFDTSAGNLSSYTLSSIAPEATRVVIGGQVTEGSRRWYSLRKNDFLDPVGWVDRDNHDSFGNRYITTSDGAWGRQKIEVDWNTNAEMFLDARDIEWEFQVRSDDDALASISPTPGSDIAIQVDQATTKALVENGPKGLLTMTAVDSPACAFGVDYQVSDVVRTILDNSFLPESMRPEDGVIREMVREVKLSSTASDIWVIEPTVGSSESSPTPYIYKELKKLRSKVEATTTRLEVNPLSSNRPNEPSLQVADPGSFTGASTGFSFTQRPQAGQAYQILVGELGSSADPGWITWDNAEVMMEFRNGEGGQWTRVSNVIRYPNSATPQFWYANGSMTGTVGDVQYVRVRFSRGGSISDWAKPTLKLTASAGPINTSGTLTLNTPPGTHRPNALFNLTGTDTTRAQLWLQVANPVGSSYATKFTAPTFSGASGNTFSIEHQVPNVTGSYNVRVVSSSQMGIGKDMGTVYQTSNAVTINVV